ncbi:hypothetical protein Cpir12675_001954 [Ceratocystis pirilliformis]|uniref:PH domain protein n=1 Tax=Ceratocystis pirilliformis TaxID=259994 RepID=A0ABR3ZDD7_9PEZI
MSGFIAKYVTKRILGESVSNKFGTEDPYFESVPATRLDGKPNGKNVRRKKANPPGLSEHDAKILTKVKRRAYRLDMCLCNCCGIRFGWGSVIGLVPAIGDVIDTLLALMVLRTCSQIEGGLPTSLSVYMLANIIVDFCVGLIPFLGDLVDAVFRANTRNAALLEAHLREVGRKNLRKSGLPIPSVDPSDPVEYDRGSLPSNSSSEERIPRSNTSRDRHSRQDRQPTRQEPMRPERSWTGHLREPDLEAGTRPKESRPASSQKKTQTRR